MVCCTDDLGEGDHDGHPRRIIIEDVVHLTSAVHHVQHDDGLIHQLDRHHVVTLPNHHRELLPTHDHRVLPPTVGFFD